MAHADADHGRAAQGQADHGQADHGQAAREADARQRLLEAGGAALPRAPWRAGRQPPSAADLIQFTLWRSHAAATGDGDLLAALAEHPGWVYDRNHLLLGVWGYSSADVETRVVDQHVANLRRKLEAAGAEGLLETVRGVGYRLVARDLDTA